MNHRGTTLKSLVRKHLRNPEFRKAYASEELPARLALRIAMLREQRGMTQKTLAKKLKVSQQALSIMENPASANYTLRTLQRVAAALNKELVVELR